MKPTTKFQSYVLGLTTLVVFTLWVNYEKQVAINPYLKVLSASIFSLGLYRFIASLLLLILNRVRLIRKFFLGPYWIGFYIGLRGNVRYIVERFEQDLETLFVRGQSYNEEYKFHTSWISYPANIDLPKGELAYMYELKGTQDVSNGTGIVFFNFHRDNKNSPPKMIKGFSADLHNDGRRTRSFEYKEADDFKITDAKALEKAIEFYEKHKNTF